MHRQTLSSLEEPGIERPQPRQRGKILASLLLLTMVGMVLSISSGAIQAAPTPDMLSTPGQPGLLQATINTQQLQFTWSSATNATGYWLEQTDILTGAVQELAPRITTTSFAVALNTLETGHWYRFRIIPTNGEERGPASPLVEVRTPGQPTYDHYFALGDSYSAGDGTPPYTGAKNCYRSEKSYPYLLGTAIPAPILIACTSAVTRNIDQAVQYEHLPGTQLGEMQSYQPGNSLVTITIGGNDADFADELTSCIFSFRACTRNEGTITQRITELTPRLVEIYRKLRQAAPAADIMVAGYPLLVADPTNAKCHNPTLKIGLSDSEMHMIRKLAGLLNSAIVQAALEAGVTPVAHEVAQAFSGHEVCARNESDEWIHEITGLNVKLKSSFHPDTDGYRAYASAFNTVRLALNQYGMVRYA